MIFLKAFLLGGALCALFQIIWMLTKAGPNTLLKAGFCISAILTPLGVTGALSEFGKGGFFVMIVGAGKSAFHCTGDALAGNLIPLLQLLGVFAAIVVIGIITAALYQKIKKA